MSGVPPARAARIAAGFTLEDVARRLNVQPAYLRQMERSGFPFHHAERLAKLYGCDMMVFLPYKRGRQDARGERARDGAPAGADAGPAARRSRLAMLPRTEIDALILTVAQEGNAAGGYTALLHVLHRAREAAEDGEPWGRSWPAAGRTPWIARRPPRPRPGLTSIWSKDNKMSTEDLRTTYTYERGAPTHEPGAGPTRLRAASPGVWNMTYAADCTTVLESGETCGAPASHFDPERGRMVCDDHNPEP